MNFKTDNWMWRRLNHGCRALRVLSCALLLECLAESSANAAAHPSITVACSPENDLFRVLQKSGLGPRRYASAKEAVDRARDGSAVLLLADGYPESTVPLSPEIFQSAADKGLHLYVEYAGFVPGKTLGEAKIAPWERLVVSSELLGGAAPKGRIMMANECFIQPVEAVEPILASARVAGYDTAVYGIPDDRRPVLFASEGGRVLVSTTKLSGFVTARFAPAKEWAAVWSYILKELTGDEIQELKWEPRVGPAYGRTERIPSRIEPRTFHNAVEWIFNSHLLVNDRDYPMVTNLLAHGGEITSASWTNGACGDGSHGILEGFASKIDQEGNQPCRVPLRADCQAETAMVLALDGALNRNRRSSNVASNLLDFIFFNSDLCKGGRGDAHHPAFGLVSWGSTAPAWMVANYGDDNARLMLATMLATASLKSDRWDESLLRALMANLRTTGREGFRGDRIDMGELERLGWRYFQDRSITNYCPPFEAYNWACFLWAYRQTRDRAFLDKTRNAIAMTMKAFPEQWRWNDNSERARMLLCLAWLVRVDDRTEHREWARRIAGELMAIQDECGAIPERFRGAEGSHYQIPKSNAAYGTGETPLLQENGNPVSDQLYVSGFALLALHEAAAALADPGIKAAEDRLARYLCRIQVRSTSLPYLSGTWFRAFDFARWEPWASSGDAGWGAWCEESGWAQAWTAAVLGLRREKTTLWDVTAHSRIRDRLGAVRGQMAVNDGGPWKSSPHGDGGKP